MQALNIYGAIAVASFGWAICDQLGVSTWKFVPLWLASALFMYNADRLRHDPADEINTPKRLLRFQRFRPASRVICVLSAATLIIWPAIQRDWLLLLLIIAGAVVCLSYSVPLFGRRLKDIGVLKTFVPPGVVTIAIVAPVVLAHGEISPTDLSCAILWVWCFTMFNMIVCDSRDVEGDRISGTVTLPLWLGVSMTRNVLIGLAAGSCVLAWTLDWKALAVATGMSLSVLLVAMGREPEEAFYEWWVEGALFLPALVRLGERMLN